MVQPSGSAALAAANRTYRNPVGMCLWQVQEWWQSGHAYPTALAQWNATVQHRDRSIPLGAPVFYGNGAGHVAEYAGGGLIRSTDAGGNGVVATVALDWPLHAWGKPYVGWGSRLGLSNLPLSGGSVPVIYLSKLHYGQTASDSVKYLQQRLNAIRFPPYVNVAVTGNYDGPTDGSVRAWQHSIGDPVDAAGHSSIGPRQAARLWAGQNVSIRP